MNFETRNTHQRRRQPVSFTHGDELDPAPPEKVPTGMFQEHYRLEGTLSCTFWANSAQFDAARKQAEKKLQHFLYRDAIEVLVDMELAVEEMDQEQLRKACLDMRDLFTGDPTP